MLYHLFSQFEDAFSGVRLIQYITFRATFAAIFAFVVATWVGPGIVASLRKRKIAGYTKTGSDEVDSQRDAKKDVPTMGGVILLIGVALSGFLFARLDNPYTWVVLLGFLAFGALGAVDDWRKLTDSQSRGISEKQKLGGQLVISLLAIGTLYALGCAQDGLDPWRMPGMKENPYALRWVKRHTVVEGESWNSLADRYLGGTRRAGEIAVRNGIDPTMARSAAVLSAAAGGDLCDPSVPEAVYHAPIVDREIDLPAAWPDARDHHRHDLQIPINKKFCFDLGLLFIPLGILVIVGASNAVNLTDGMDGLAIGTTATVAIAFAFIAYVVGRVDFSQELYLFYVPEGGEIAIICAALVGGSLGFLWFNCYPAQVFMGDTGSLSIGGILGLMAVALRHEFTLLLAGGLFVMEALSVIWQRVYFKGTRRKARKAGVAEATGKRWFRCAPFHHHYQMGGMHESKVVIRFWIVSVICVLTALALVKVR
ncbi:MAG: phospho-N-acetylmuramoyl-pentapeptide-transferase [Planctomycetota bacterium]|nr:phospho-N-acetylmuramoyl-pentapeptide-transferase [Planctomycetota bacterium]